ncbi:MAG: 2-amino-4-hydroxy-6-hydroxymethyldihydropteridine diphosphokinase [Acidimicrobiia bacterium]
MTRFAISMGSNRGDRIGHLRRAIEELSEGASIESISSLYETAPVGGPEQGSYLNAVVVLTSETDAHGLLALLHRIEAGSGRTRKVRWGPRTLDLDIVATDGEPVDDGPKLIVPHPRAGERRFVLEPLAEIWPEAPLGGGATAGDMLTRVSDQEVVQLARSWVKEPIQGRFWVGGQLVVFALIALAIAGQGSLPRMVTPWRVGGTILALAGLALMLWSARSLGRNLTAMPEPLPGGELVARGPYRLVRHPMYTSVFLLFVGVSTVFDSIGAVLLSVLLIGFFALKSRYEERQLRIAYPGYGLYLGRVPERFFPIRPTDHQ